MLALLQLYSGYVMYYKPGLKHYYYIHVCSNKYYCLLIRMFIPHWLCLSNVRCPVYNYKSQTILQLYFDHVMYYKFGLKYYYYFCVCSNKYCCLLKKKKKENSVVYPTLVVCVQCPLFITLVYNYKGQTFLQQYSGYVIYYKFGLKDYYYFHVCSNKYYCLLKIIIIIRMFISHWLCVSNVRFL